MIANMLKLICTYLEHIVTYVNQEALPPIQRWPMESTTTSHTPYTNMDLPLTILCTIEGVNSRDRINSRWTTSFGYQCTLFPKVAATMFLCVGDTGKGIFSNLFTEEVNDVYSVGNVCCEVDVCPVVNACREVITSRGD